MATSSLNHQTGNTSGKKQYAITDRMIDTGLDKVLHKQIDDKCGSLVIDTKNEKVTLGYTMGTLYHNFKKARVMIITEFHSQLPIRLSLENNANMAESLIMAARDVASKSSCEGITTAIPWINEALEDQQHKLTEKLRKL